MSFIRYLGYFYLQLFSSFFVVLLIEVVELHAMYMMYNIHNVFVLSLVVADRQPQSGRRERGVCSTFGEEGPMY